MVSVKTLSKAISNTMRIVIVVVIIVIIAAGGYTALVLTSTKTSSTTSSTYSSSSSSSTSTSVVASTSSSSSQSQNIPSALTYETSSTPQYLDPDVMSGHFDLSIAQNIYEPLLWYNGPNSTDVIPWLAQSFSISSNHKQANFTLRSGITFADGEALNSTAVYFSYNRFLIEDSSSPAAFGVGVGLILQQLLNPRYSWALSHQHQWNTTWLQGVLAENFVQVTSPMTFTLNIQNPSAAFEFLISTQPTDIIAPEYVMQHDLALWNASNTGYNLPYPNLSGNLNNQINEYFNDMVATCGTGVTPKGCGQTYLDTSAQGSLAGTGPYVLTSYNPSTNDMVLTANTNYWGGPFQFMPSNSFMPGQKIVAQINTININYVPQLTTREIDLQTAARAGQAMTIDVPNVNVYDVANRSAWVNEGVLRSTIPNTVIYGPYTTFEVTFEMFETNVTNPITGQYYPFQPFADRRIRLAFADSVNMSEIDSTVNNNLGKVAINGMDPGLPPTGTFNSSITPVYSYSLYQAQTLLLSAMENPITSFTFLSGKPAPSGTFDNSFGCTTLNSKGVCSNPIKQSITLSYASGDLVSETVLEGIASAINNISQTYNMGLTVGVEAVPLGQLDSQGFARELYMWSTQSVPEWPWAGLQLQIIFQPAAFFSGVAGWNLSSISAVFPQVFVANSAGNVTGIAKLGNVIAGLANQAVMQIWEFYPEFFQIFTSNVHGYYYNPSMLGTVQYYAELS